MSETAIDHPLERLAFFSDAVFAIAITLLVIEIQIPDLPLHVPVAEQWARLGALWPSFFAFVLSFLVIGRFWMGHHALFAQIRHYDARLMWPNLTFLMAIALMPFASAFLGRNLGHFVPELIYNLTMLTCGALSLWLVRAARRAGILKGSDDELPLTARSASVVLAAAVCAGLTFASPLLSQWGMVTIPLWLRLPLWLRRQKPDQTA